MMRKCIAILVAGILLLGSSAAMAEGNTPSVGQWLDGAVSSMESWVKDSGELEVQGQAVRSVAPDTVTIRVGANVEDKSEKIAQDQANAIIQEVISSIRALGVEDSQIATSGYNITRKSSSSKLLGTDSYVAKISLTITVQDFDLINQILDTAVEKGANDVGSISFSYSREGEVYRQALSDAILAARVKAEAMAETAGVRLHTLLALREVSGGGAYRNTYEPMMAESSSYSGTQIMAGEIEITAYVTLMYQVK